MTKELAQRIVDRPSPSRARVTDAQRTEILMDWLAGMPYRELMDKYGVGKTTISGIITKAKRDAQIALRC